MTDPQTDAIHSAPLDPSLPLTEWTRRLAAAAPTPAGGSAAAAAGALAAALAQMVAGLTAKRAADLADQDEAREMAARAERMRLTLLDLAVADARIFSAALAARKGKPNAKPGGAQMLEAARLQRELLGLAREVGALGLLLAEHGFAPAMGDAASAVFLAAGVGRCAYWALRADVQGDESEEAQQLRGEALAALQRLDAMEWEVRLVLDGKLR
jgi:formiminotetrahydrofolate cyclodeaminase